MTIHWGREIPGWFIFTCIVVICLLKLFVPESIALSHNYSTSIRGNEYASPLHDSLPHYRFKQIEDSLKLLEVKKDFFAQDRGGSEGNFSSLGVASFGKEKESSKFFVVTGYTLEEFSSVKNELSSTILHYPVWDKVDEDNREGHLATQILNIKYKEGKERWEGQVLVPISSTLYTILQIILYALSLVLVISFFYAVLFIPFRLLFRLSKGQAFNEENIGGLYLTAWTLINLALLITSVSIIGHLVIRSQVPESIHFSYYNAFIKTSNVLLAGLAVLLLAKAFLQGLELREEKDLTI